MLFSIWPTLVMRQYLSIPLEMIFDRCIAEGMFPQPGKKLTSSLFTRKIAGRIRQIIAPSPCCLSLVKFLKKYYLILFIVISILISFYLKINQVSDQETLQLISSWLLLMIFLLPLSKDVRLELFFSISLRILIRSGMKGWYLKWQAMGLKVTS